MLLGRLLTLMSYCGNSATIGLEILVLTVFIVTSSYLASVRSLTTIDNRWCLIPVFFCSFCLLFMSLKIYAYWQSWLYADEPLLPKGSDSSSDDIICFSEVDIVTPAQKMTARKLKCDIVAGKSLLVTGWLYSYLNTFVCIHNEASVYLSLFINFSRSKWKWEKFCLQSPSRTLASS